MLAWLAMADVRMVKVQYLQSNSSVCVCVSVCWGRGVFVDQKNEKKKDTTKGASNLRVKHPSDR